MGYREYQQSWDQIKQMKSPRLFSGDIKILVVEGCFDHAEQVLESAGISFDSVPEHFSRSLEGYDIIIVNCPGNLGDSNIKKIQKFVEKEGFLISTDWALQYLIEKAFPGTIAYNGTVSEGRAKLKIVNSNHPFTKSLEGTPNWEIDGGSFRIKVNSRRVDVLAISDGGVVKKKDPLIVTFGWGSGRVLHMISHVYLQSASLRDTFPSALLLCNVLEDKAVSKGILELQPIPFDLSKVQSTPLFVDSRPSAAMIKTVATFRATCPAKGDIISPGQCVYYCPSCKVQFHEGCIRQYLAYNRGCPICKKPIRI
ncbi:MAG: hypothetical protein HXS44_16255 [Theionarchaea archaeon]|nr:hypothetical protein [Theionarchaea archaeon]